MKRDLIAQVAHEVNRAYCASIGDLSVKPWTEASEQQQRSILAGVDMHLANPEATPEETHASWLATKINDGWAYGEVKDEAAKQHPCCVPYDELPAAQKSKDYLFRAVVQTLASLPEAEPTRSTATDETSHAIVGRFRPEPLPNVAVVNGEVNIRYIGRRETFTDRIYGTKLTFDQGQARKVPEAIGKSFLKHVDLFELAATEPVQAVPQRAAPTAKEDNTAELLEQSAKEKAERDAKQKELQDLHDQVAQMDKNALEHFALTKYRQQIDKRLTVPKLREQVVGFINQFGVV